MMDLDGALKLYYDTFGVNYPLFVARVTSDAEETKKILECVQKRKKAKPIVYEENTVY